MPKKYCIECFKGTDYDSGGVEPCECSYCKASFISIAKAAGVATHFSDEAKHPSLDNQRYEMKIKIIDDARPRGLSFSELVGTNPVNSVDFKIQRKAVTLEEVRRSAQSSTVDGESLITEEHD